MGQLSCAREPEEPLAQAHRIIPGRCLYPEPQGEEPFCIQPTHSGASSAITSHAYRGDLCVLAKAQRTHLGEK